VKTSTSTAFATPLLVALASCGVEGLAGLDGLGGDFRDSEWGLTTTGPSEEGSGAGERHAPVDRSWPPGAPAVRRDSDDHRPHPDSSYGVRLGEFEPSRRIRVDRLEAFQRAIDGARPGDRIVLAPGTYETTAAIRVKARGTRKKPIVIAAGTTGDVKIRGVAGFSLDRAAYVVIHGFIFRHEDAAPAFAASSCHNVRFSHNVIRLTEPKRRKSHWVVVGGKDSHHNRIDHNRFERKSNLGVMLKLGGAQNSVTRHDRVDNNHFRDRPRGTGNGFETIRIGTSHLSHLSSRTLIELNLFERCDGEAEIVSVKTQKNYIRYNTFRDSAGSLTLRNTHGCEVVGNFFLNPSGKKNVRGIRVFGSKHRILNNYFSGMTKAAISIRSGDTNRITRARAKYPAGEYPDYQRPDRSTIAYNTIVNCKHAFEFGDERYPLLPRRLVFQANLVVQKSGEVFDLSAGEPVASLWQQNMIFGAEGQTLPSGLAPSAIWHGDSKLRQADGIWRLTSGSPARDAVQIGDCPRRDIYARKRTDGRCDVGADEFGSGKRLRRPLDL
jgi:poly(beta-D-mannuronate) lyase